MWRGQSRQLVLLLHEIPEGRTEVAGGGGAAWQVASFRFPAAALAVFFSAGLDKFLGGNPGRMLSHYGQPTERIQSIVQRLLAARDCSPAEPRSWQAGW